MATLATFSLDLTMEPVCVCVTVKATEMSIF